MISMHWKRIGKEVGLIVRARVRRVEQFGHYLLYGERDNIVTLSEIGWGRY